MVGTTGTVTRTVSVQDVKHVGGQARVEGEHDETVTEACIVVGVVKPAKEGDKERLRVVVFSDHGVSEGREVDEDGFTAAS
jgi:hypothetical protein